VEPRVPPSAAPVHLPSTTLVGVLSRVRAGDLGAEDPALRQRINDAFAKHHRRLHALVASELRGFSEQQVEDTVQEALAIAWRKLATHDGRSFRAWLFAIATHQCANVRRKRREALPGDDALFDAASEVETVYATLRREERERLLRDAAAAVLDAQAQEIVHMRYELDLPRDEVARLAGLDDADQVRVVLQRSRRLLVKEIERRLQALGHGMSLLAED
jgi:RNA polymerase sigma factor (sigma-70 family)